MQKLISVTLLLASLVLSACSGNDTFSVNTAEPASEWGVLLTSFDDLTADSNPNDPLTNREAGNDPTPENPGGTDSDAFMVEIETVAFGESKYTMEMPIGWVHANYEDDEFLAAFAAGRETLTDFLNDEAAVDWIQAVPPDKFKENAGVAFFIEPYSLDREVPLRVLVFYANAANILNFTEYVQGEVRRLSVTWGSEKVESQRLDEYPNCENYEVIYAFKYGDTETASIRYYLKFENEFILLQFTAQKGVYQNLGLDYFRKIARSVEYVGE